MSLKGKIRKGRVPMAIRDEDLEAVFRLKDFRKSVFNMFDFLSQEASDLFKQLRDMGGGDAINLEPVIVYAIASYRVGNALLRVAGLTKAQAAMVCARALDASYKDKVVIPESARELMWAADQKKVEMKAVEADMKAATVSVDKAAPPPSHASEERPSNVIPFRPRPRAK